MFIVGGAVSLLTFKNWAGLSATNPVGIFIVTYIVNAIFLFVYVVSQIILVVGTLEDRWPLGDITFGIFFFVIGQVILYVFSETICNSVQHYLDGLFFATICNLLAVMMIYKVSLPHRNSIVRLALTDLKIVLGFDHARGPRILRRRQAAQLGSQRTTPRRGQTRNHVPRVRIRPITIPAAVQQPAIALLCRGPLSYARCFLLFLTFDLVFLRRLLHGIQRSLRRTWHSIGFASLRRISHLMRNGLVGLDVRLGILGLFRAGLLCGHSIAWHS